MSLLRVTAHMSAPIVSSEEIHLDALLIAARPGPGPCPTRSTPVAEITYPPLPIPRVAYGGQWVYACSTWSLPPDAQGGLEHLTKRRDPGDVHELSRPYTPGSGKGRDYMLPVPVVEAPSVSWLCVGDRQGLRRLLRYVRAVGSMRRHGYGVVDRWEVTREDEGQCGDVLVRGAFARRWLPAAWCPGSPSEAGPVVPPYWHPGLSCERVRPGVRAALAPGVVAAVDRLT
jgi:hypothetical protein